MSEATVYLKNYQAPVFSVTSIDLNFDLYDDHALVTNHMQLERAHAGALFLFGEELELVSIHLNGALLAAGAYHLDEKGLTITSCPDSANLSIVTRIYPQKNTALSGLYRSNHLFCTQCEAQGFRRITYFLDRPDVLSMYTTRISADKTQYPVLLSNGNLSSSGDTSDGRHWVLWEDPFKKPSYLFALVAGKLACVKDEFITCSGKKVDLRIYVEPGNEDKCAHAMISLKKAMRWDEEIYGREYDLSIFMIVAVSDFNMGAMENKGLNIFNSKYILARPDTATDQDYADIEGVVAHEYFHNWTGNRVTCRDWFQLSLKEGLTVFRDQEFSRDMNSRDVGRLLDVKVLRNAQFPEDAGSMAHPVRPESYQEINNFYTTTIYNKGAEVIRMQHTLLGADGFRQGMDLYFERHDGQAVTIDDFVAAMEDANSLDLTQFKRWYSQAGTPDVRVTTHYHNGCLELTLTQSCRVTPECANKQPFHIPIRMALLGSQGEVLERRVLELKDKEQMFRFEGLTQKPIVSLLHDFSAPITLTRDMSSDELLTLLRFETDGFSKWDAAQRLAVEDIKQRYQNPQIKAYLPENVSMAYQHVLRDNSLDLALRAELLTPPGFEDIAISLTNIDVTRLENARHSFRESLGQALFQDLQATYLSLWEVEDHAMNGQAYGRRKLRRICLSLMMAADEEKTTALCQEQFVKAKTMTDQINALALLVNSSQAAVREEALAAFYQQWKHEDLVMDKWFSLQACCERPDTLNHVKELLKHPGFNIKNPNKVRALIGAFSQSNPRNFHAQDGSGYEFLTDMLIQLDKLNPQIAARLATPYTRWQRLNKERQALIKQQLTRLSGLSLSRDLQELVVKGLETS